VVEDGTDLVTGLAPDFRMTSLVAHPSVKHANINPFTTLIVESAGAMPGGPSDDNIAAARAAIIDQLNFGLDPLLIPDPIETEITDAKAAVIVKASEVLGEMIRRSRDRLLSTGVVASADDVVNALAADMADGRFDGLGASGAGHRVSAVAKLGSAQVLIEALSNNLYVHGESATDKLDAAIVSTRPSTPASALTGGVRINAEMLVQARGAVAAARLLSPSIELTTIAGVLDNIQANSVAADIEPLLPADSSADLDTAIALAVSAGEAQLLAVNTLEPTVTPSADTGTENTAPQLTGEPAAVALEDSAYLFQPTATDPDGDSLSFAIQNRPGWAGFDATSGRLSGTPDNGDVGVYSEIRISVSDGTASTSLGPFTITVNNSNDAPSISGSPTDSVSAETAYSFQPSASDPDGDSLVFSIAGRPAWAAFDAGSGRLWGTPLNSDAGSYDNILISVSDGTVSRSLPAFSITVQAVVPPDPGPDPNTAPTIGGSPAGSVDEDSTYLFQPAAADADGDALSFSISNRPAWASFDTGSGRLSGTPVNADVGSYSDIVISVSDGSASDALGPFAITVRNVNDAPAISGTPATSVDENSDYDFQPSASDADGDSLVFSVAGRPAWASFDSGSGRLWGTPASGDAGTTGDIQISVSDGSASVALPAFSITVNSAPVQTGSALLSWTAPTARADGTALALSEIAGYTVYYGTAAGDYPNSLDIDDGSATTVTIADLPADTYYMVVTTRDSSGRESVHSTEVVKPID
jgi:hypothetical protein